MKAITRASLMGGMLLALLLPTRAQEWTRFRGPNGSGLGQGEKLPSHWSEREYRWRAPLPGQGHSSPVLWGEQLFVTSADAKSGKFSVVALNATDGKLSWEKTYEAPHYRLHANNNYASATPATDARRVYLLRIDNAQLVLTALFHNGSPAWEFKTGSFRTEHGLGHSPVVHGNLVVFVDDQDLAGRVVAVDSETGRLIWETKRSAGRADYSTPCVFEVEGRPPALVLNSFEDGVCAVNLGDGTLLWKAARVLDKRSVSSPIVADGLVTASCGSGGGGNYLVTLQPPLHNGEEPRVAYEVRRAAPYVPTPLALGKLLFLWSDGGIVTCIDVATGKTHWQQRVGGNYFSSPVCADGKLYGVSTSGEVVVLAAAAQFKELGRTPLGESSHATPAVANGSLYFRTLGQLFCIGRSERH